MGGVKIAKYNHEWFINRIKERRPHDFEEYEFLDPYVNSHTYLKALHKTCGSHIEVLPNSFISRNAGCQKCARVSAAEKQMKTQEQFEAELPDGMECLGTYSGAFKKVLVHCGLCSTTYDVRPHDLLRRGCTRCSGSYRRGLEDVKKEIELASRGDYRVISTTYKNSHKPLIVEHIECGYRYPVSRANFIYKGRRCPNCSTSIGEKLVKDVLTDLGVQFFEQQKFEDLVYKSNLSYDFYLPEQDLLIEYQGEQHYKPVEFFGGEEAFEIQQMLDTLKRDYASKEDIALLEIPYTVRTYEEVRDILVGVL